MSHTFWRFCKICIIAWNVIVDSSLNKLNLDLVSECMKWNTESEKLNWRLLQTRFNQQYISCDGQEQINNHLTDEIIRLLNEFGDKTIHKKSALFHNLTNTIRKARLSPKFIANVPRMIAFCHQYLASLSDQRESASNSDELSICEMIFVYYPITKAKWSELDFLIYASIEIMENIADTYQNQMRPSRSIQDIDFKMSSPKLDAWRLLYGFLFDHFAKNKQSQLPELRQIPYLDNKTYIESLMDEEGLIVYSPRFIDAEWCYDEFEEYMIALGEISSLITNEALWQAFVTEFLIKFFRYHYYDLDSNPMQHCDRETGLELGLVIYEAAQYLVEIQDYDKLELLLSAVRDNNGLQYLQRVSGVIIAIKEYFEISRFVELLITANLRYDICVEQVTMVSNMIARWMTNDWKHGGTEMYRVYDAINSIDFDEKLIDELLNIHLSFKFTFDMGRQLEFFVWIMSGLMEQRNDINIEKETIDFCVVHNQIFAEYGISKFQAYT